ncbi:MAG: phosphoribosylformylglycinamidine synthase, partial [Treponema sp.]|nr:phosphoribosylformylglycinamidine synthase [Treponema sp.]
MFRIYVERQKGFENEARRILSDVKNFLGVSSVKSARYLNRYDIENVMPAVAKTAVQRIFSEPQSDSVIYNQLSVKAGETQIIWEYLPGQYDQRADSAEQCLSLLRKSLEKSVETGKEPPRVRCAKIVILTGKISAKDVQKIQSYLVNPVDSRLASEELPSTLKMKTEQPGDIPVVDGFIKFKKAELESYLQKMGLAMDYADIKFLQDYFAKEGRDPTETEIRVLDTYWSDHCRHTTFLTELKDIKIEKGTYEKLIKASLKEYDDMRADLYAGRSDKPVTLMDMAVIGIKHLK